MLPRLSGDESGSDVAFALLQAERAQNPSRDCENLLESCVLLLL